MTTITLIRHGQSQFNISIDTTNPNLINCPLTEYGIIQSNNLTFEFDLLILSPLKRAQQTFTHSNIKCKNVITNDLFREYKTNICDFLETEEPNYETETQFLNRIRQAKTYIKSLNYKNIGIITHGDFIWYFTSHTVDNERFGTWLHNAEHTQINI